MARPGIRIVYSLMAIALLLSVVLVLNSFGLLEFQGGEFHTAKEYALSLLDYNLDLAKDLDIPSNDTRVNLFYQRLLDSVNNAATPEELYSLILTDMSRFEEIIREQATYNLTNWLDWVVNQDPNLNELDATTEVTFSFHAEQLTTIEGGDFLDQTTIDKIISYSLPGELVLQTVTIVIEVDGDLVMTRVKEPLIEQDPIGHLQNQYKFLEQEYNNLMAAAGYSELTGPGLTIALMDAEDDLIYDEMNIIHDVDVQEIVHSLYASGAKGITIGDRRLVATSSIRCVGGPILVNYYPVPVKPLVIKAVGDPEAMLDYLTPLFEYYTDERSLRLEVTTETELRLPGQSLR